MGRTAYGVRGIQLREGDEVVAMEVVSDDAHAADRLRERLRQAHRASASTAGRRAAASASRTSRRRDRNGLVIGIACVTDRDELLIVTEQGQIIRMKAGDLRPIGRDTQGVRLIDLAEGDRVVSIATLTEPRTMRSADGGPEPTSVQDA